MPRVLAALFFCAAMFLGSGCASYKLGPTNGEAAGSRSVEFRPFLNQTPEPRLVEALTGALRKNLQRDGTYTLNTHGDGDVLVTGTLTRYSRDALSFQPRDILTVRDFRLTLAAKVTAVDRRSGRTLFDREITGRTTLRIGGDQTSAERQALPLLAEDLGRNVISTLCEGTW